MWSDRYNYYNLQSDRHYSGKLKTEEVIRVFLETGLFVQKNHQVLCNAAHFPWVEMILVKTKDGNFAASANKIPYTNLVAIVCSKGQERDDKMYVDTFLKIAKTLNWKLYLEEDDNGNEDTEVTSI